MTEQLIKEANECRDKFLALIDRVTDKGFKSDTEIALQEPKKTIT